MWTYGRYNGIIQRPVCGLCICRGWVACERVRCARARRYVGGSFVIRVSVRICGQYWQAQCWGVQMESNRARTDPRRESSASEAQARTFEGVLNTRTCCITSHCGPERVCARWLKWNLSRRPFHGSESSWVICLCLRSPRMKMMKQRAQQLRWWKGTTICLQ